MSHIESHDAVRRFASVRDLDSRYDVVVAGARCAGASTAMLLARGGLRVLVVDPLPRGRDTLSTHALMRGAVLQLHRWGLLDQIRAGGAPTITATTFDYADEAVTVDIAPSGGVDGLYAPRRTLLDPVLVDAAEEAGATVVHGLSVVDLDRDEAGRVRGVVVAGPDRVPRVIASDLVVGADGLRSRVARIVNAPTEHVARHATASVYGYWKGLKRDEFRWYFRPGCGIGIIPTDGGLACVFASVAPEELRLAHDGEGGQGVESLFHRVIEEVDSVLAERLRPGLRSGPLRSFAGVRGFLRTPVGPGWALVGDAGYFKDPLTAHGITDALRDAELLARAAAAGGDAALLEYQERRDAAAHGLMDVTDRIASLAWDTARVKELHLELSREMKRDVEIIRALDASGPTDRRRRSA